MLEAPTLGDGTPERDGVGVWKVRNSGYVAPIGVLPGVEIEVGIATGVWLVFGVEVRGTWLTSPGDSPSDMPILEQKWSYTTRSFEQISGVALRWAPTC